MFSRRSFWLALLFVLFLTPATAFSASNRVNPSAAAQLGKDWETAIEDDEIALRMDRGRRALMQQGISQAGPYQSPMEDGMLHFHEYLRRELGKPA